MKGLLKSNFHFIKLIKMYTNMYLKIFPSYQEGDTSQSQFFQKLLKFSTG